MKGKGAAILFCLAFALPFGGVGAGATWAMATMIYDGLRAKEWVRVKADVTGDSSYRYAFKGVEYRSDRLGTFRLGGTTDVDDFDDRVGTLFAEARGEKRPITVFVNPDNPSESMVDRTIRWALLVFLVPFGLAFGAVGVGAFVVLAKMLRAPSKGASGARRRGTAIAARSVQSTGTGLGGLWLFALVWNAIALPVGILAIRQAIDEREWLLLFVAIFPLIGLLILWGALAATFARLRRGKPEFRLATAHPRPGAPLEGHFEFARGVRAGDVFNVRVVCERTFRNGEETSITPHWTREVKARAMDAPTGVRVPFRVDIPASMPATSDEDDDRPVTHDWRVELEPDGKGMGVPYRQEVRMGHASFESPHAPVVEEPVRIDPGLQQLLGTFEAGPLTSEQQRALARMTPQQQAALAKVLRFAPSPRKIVLAVVGLIVALEVVPLLFRTLAH